MQQIIAELIQSVKDNKNITDSVLKFKEKMDYWGKEELSEVFGKELEKYSDEEAMQIIKKLINIPSCHIKKLAIVLVEILGSNDEIFIRLHDYKEVKQQEKGKEVSEELEPIIETIIQDLKQDIVNEENIISMNEKMNDTYYQEMKQIFDREFEKLEEKEFFIVIRNAIKRYQKNNDLYRKLTNQLIDSKSEMIKKVLLYIETK